MSGLLASRDGLYLVLLYLACEASTPNRVAAESAYYSALAGLGWLQ